MIYSKSQVMKNRATAAKRTATALRDLAESSEFEIADRGLLLKAAEVLAVFGAVKSRSAKAEKQREDEFNAAVAKATTRARQLLGEWDVKTTLGYLALIHVSGSGWVIGKMASEMAAGDYPRDIRWPLEYHFDQAMRDIPATIGYSAVKDKTGVEVAMADLHTKYHAAGNDPAIVAAATRINRMFEEFDAARHQEAA